MTNSCFNCGSPGFDMYGYCICTDCKAKLGLFSEKTIKRHSELYKSEKKERSYAEEIDYRLKKGEIDFIKGKLKLLHIKEVLRQL